MDKILEFTGNHTLLVTALIISFFVVVFTELRRKASGLVNIGTTEAVKLINGDAAVIDLRTAEAYTHGHIVNAHNVAVDQLLTQVNALGLDQSKPLLAVCDAGVTTTKAVTELREAGFASAYGLKGGMNGWSQDGLPVVAKKKTKPKKGKKGKKG